MTSITVYCLLFGWALSGKVTGPGACDRTHVPIGIFETQLTYDVQGVCLEKV